MGGMVLTKALPVQKSSSRLATRARPSATLMHRRCTGRLLMRRRLLFGLVAALSAVSAHALPASLKVVAQLSAGDGGWDLLSVSPTDHRLYVAHGDRVT